MQTAADHPKHRPLSVMILARFHLVGTKSFNLADHIAVSGRRREMSEHSVRGGNVAGLLERFAQLQEKARAERVAPFDHRHSGSGVGRLLDSSCAAE